MTRIREYDVDAVMSLLGSVSLFADTDQGLLRTFLKNGDLTLCEYSAGEVICAPGEEKYRMVIFFEGEAEVYSADEHRAMLLRTLCRGGVVGVANLFSGEDFVSRVIAAKKCVTVEISSEKYGKLLEKDARAMYNYVTFLSDRIRYLNRKIVMLTAGSAERRLAYFLDSSLSDHPQAKGEPPEITVQMNSLCEMLNLGRASLYRAADKLCEEGLIRREGKKIIVLDRGAMMEKYR